MRILRIASTLISLLLVQTAFSQSTVVSTVAQLQSNNWGSYSSLYLLSYSSGGTTGGGELIKDSTDPVSAVNPCTIFEDSGGNLWQRAGNDNALDPNDCGADPTGTTASTTAINKAFELATTKSWSIHLSCGTYRATNLIFGSNSTSGAQSSAPLGIRGSGRCSVLLMDSTASGEFLAAQSLSGVLFEDFVVDCNNNAAETKCLDTGWPNGGGVSQQNRYSYVWVQNYYGTGWEALNNNQTTFDSVTVRQPHGTSQTAIDLTAPGGSIYVVNSNWALGILDVCAQNATIVSGFGSGIRINNGESGGGCTSYDVLGVYGTQLYADATSKYFIWDASPGTPGHSIANAVISATEFPSVTSGNTLFNFNIENMMLIEGLSVEGTQAATLYGPQFGIPYYHGSGVPVVYIRGINTTSIALTINSASIGSVTTVQEVAAPAGNPIQTSTAGGSFTVSTLPSGAKRGTTAYVTDATSCSKNGSLTGGGSAFCMVIFNGTSWVGS